MTYIWRHMPINTLKRKGSWVEFVKWPEGARCDRQERESEIFKWPRRMRFFWHQWGRWRRDRNRTNNPCGYPIYHLEYGCRCTDNFLRRCRCDRSCRDAFQTRCCSLPPTAATVLGVIGIAGLCGVRSCAAMRKAVCWSTRRAWSCCRRAWKWSKPVRFAISEENITVALITESIWL